MLSTKSKDISFKNEQVVQAMNDFSDARTNPDCGRMFIWLEGTGNDREAYFPRVADKSSK